MLMLQKLKGTVTLKRFLLACNVFFVTRFILSEQAQSQVAEYVRNRTDTSLHNLYPRADSVICFLVIILGTLMIKDEKTYEILVGSTVKASASIVVSLGIIIFFISIFGIWGIIKEDRKVILIYSVLLACTMILNITVIILTMATGTKFEKTKMKNFFMDKVKEYSQKIEVQNAWEEIQQDLKCCGVNNASDWGDKIPPSCCKNPPGEEDEICQDINIFKNGCWEGVRRKVRRFRKEMLIRSFLGLILKGIVVVCACFMVKGIKRKELESHSIREESRGGKKPQTGKEEKATRAKQIQGELT